MKPIDIEKLIADKLPDSLVQIKSDDEHHFFATIISKNFEGLSLLKRQQMIYAMLQSFIADGSIHAFSMQTYTPSEWHERQLQ